MYAREFFERHKKIKSRKRDLKIRQKRRFSVLNKRQTMIAQVIQIVGGNLNSVTYFLHFQA